MKLKEFVMKIKYTIPSVKYLPQKIFCSSIVSFPCPPKNNETEKIDSSRIFSWKSKKMRRVMVEIKELVMKL